MLFNAAGWSQLPTFLNKATLLSDATAAMLGGCSTPDQALAFLGKYNQHWWKMRSNSSHWEAAFGAYAHYTVTQEVSLPTIRNVIYSDSIIINNDGSYQLAAPTSTVAISYDEYARLATLRGKYFQGTGRGGDAAAGRAV